MACAGSIAGWDTVGGSAGPAHEEPILGRQIGPLSRSAAKKEKLPAFVHKVTMVRATSSGWLVNGWTFRHFDVPM